MARTRHTTVTAADANRRFSRILHDVRDGRTIVVTSHGRPVARIVPITAEDDRVASRARASLLERLKSQRPANAARWTRDELYDE